MKNYSEQARQYLITNNIHTTEKLWQVEEILRQFNSEYPVIECGSGWLNLISTLHESLLKVYPQYKIVQCKEKFGTLRFYIEEYPTSTVQSFMVHACIAHAEQLSSRVCMCCGINSITDTPYRRVMLRSPFGWMHTYCDNCELDYINGPQSRNTYNSLNNTNSNLEEYRQELISSIERQKSNQR